MPDRSRRTPFALQNTAHQLRRFAEDMPADMRRTERLYRLTRNLAAFFGPFIALGLAWALATGLTLLISGGQ